MCVFVCVCVCLYVFPFPFPRSVRLEKRKKKSFSKINHFFFPLDERERERREEKKKVSLFDRSLTQSSALILPRLINAPLCALALMHTRIHKENSFEIFLAAGFRFSNRDELRVWRQVPLNPLPTVSSSSPWWETF